MLGRQSSRRLAQECRVAGQQPLTRVELRRGDEEAAVEPWDRWCNTRCESQGVARETCVCAGGKALLEQLSRLQREQDGGGEEAGSTLARRGGGDGGARCTTCSSSLGSLAGPSLLDKQNEGPRDENKRRSTVNRGRGETSSAGRGSSPPRRLASRPASHQGAWALAALHPGGSVPPPSPGSSLELPSSHLARLLPRAGRVGSPPARRPAFPAAPSSSSQRG